MLDFPKWTISHGVDQVYLAEHDMLKDFRTIPYTRVLLELIAKRRPQIVLYGATNLGRDLAPWVLR